MAWVLPGHCRHTNVVLAYDRYHTPQKVSKSPYRYMDPPFDEDIPWTMVRIREADIMQ